MADDERTAVIIEFHDVVNMTPHELEAWLKTDESKDVGWVAEGATESVGHTSGRHTVRILHKKRADYTTDDIAHMRKVIGYVRRHLAQGGPEHDKAHSRWAYSLKNWGHDPAR